MEGNVVYDIRINFRTADGCGEWVVDGERGVCTYPFSWPKCMVRRLYMDGLDKPPKTIVGKGGYCDGCIGADYFSRCGKEMRA